VVPELLGATGKLVGHPDVAALYPEYLIMCHGIVRATIPLMETALAGAETRPADPVYVALAGYLRQHIDEESGEDEWLLADLEAVGRERDEVLARPPSPTIAALVGAQYYWVLHYDPVAVLGLFAGLETHPPSRRLIDGLIAATGHDPSAFRTLVAHAERDPGHRDELHQFLDGLGLTADQWTLLGLSAMHSVHMLARALAEITD